MLRHIILIYIKTYAISTEITDFSNLVYVYLYDILTTTI